MLRLLLLLGTVVLVGAAMLTGPHWLPLLLAGGAAPIRWGAGLALLAGALLLVLGRLSGAPARILVPVLLVLAGTGVIVPLLLHRTAGPAPMAQAPATEAQEASGAPPPDSAPAETAEPETGGLVREVKIPADPSGHFLVRARVDGTWITFLVDTGATQVALSDADARRIGLRPVATDFRHPVRTANGTAMTAPATLREIEIGPIRVRDVPAQIAASGLGVSLLGMSFLGRLSGYAVRDGVLYLRK